MPAPKLPPIKIPWFKQYAVIIGAITIGILALTIYIAYMAKDELLYPRLTSGQIAENLTKYKNMQIGLRGLYLNFSIRQKPLCSPQGGSKEYPEIRKSYKSLPAVWGVTDGQTDIAVKVVNVAGEELSIAPEYQNGTSVELKGTVRLTTTLDECNLDVAYQSAYLEIRPEQIGLEEK